MRWIFFLLVVGNLLLLLLMFQSGKREEAGLPAIGELEVFPITGSSRENGSPAGASPGPGSSNSASVMRCQRVGPFDSRALALEVTAEITRYGLASNISTESRELVKDFWVIQTPKVTGEHLEEDLARLQRAGMTDVAAVEEGEHSGGISLGIFELRDNAIRRRQEVDRYGLTAEIVERTRDRDLFWVDIYESPDKKLTPEELESLKLDFDVAVTFEDVECP